MSADPRDLYPVRIEPPRLTRTHVYAVNEAATGFWVATLGIGGDIAIASVNGLDLDELLYRRPISIGEVRALPEPVGPMLRVARSLPPLLTVLSAGDAHYLQLSARSPRRALPAPNTAAPGAALEAELGARDADCAGGSTDHVWIYRDALPEDDTWCLWHFNRSSGALVPPKPVILSV